MATVLLFKDKKSNKVVSVGDSNTPYDKTKYKTVEVAIELSEETSQVLQENLKRDYGVSGEFPLQKSDNKDWKTNK